MGSAQMRSQCILANAVLKYLFVNLEQVIMGRLSSILEILQC
jgi:hypothetical protein